MRRSQAASSLWLRISLACLLCAALSQSLWAQLTVRESPEMLRQRREALESRLNAIEAGKIQADTAELHDVQAKLLQVTGEEDAARQEIAAGSKGLLGERSIIAVPVYYVTDRARRPEGHFGGDLSGTGLEYGKSLVTLAVDYPVRADLLAGARHLPQRSPISEPTVDSFNGMDDLLAALRANQRARDGQGRRVLLFVHGYNVSFNDALTETARLSSKVQLPVVPLVFSWPSDGAYGGYWHDEESVRASERRFARFLQELLVKSPIEVVIVCHSMGARELTPALAELGRQKAKNLALHHVIYAAADISAQEFLEAWPDLRALGTAEFTFYASNHDLALRLSHIVHRFPRLGDASPSVTVPIGATTVDASAVDPFFQDVGHSYILNSARIAADVGSWIADQESPADRGLVSVVVHGQPYYLFP